MKAKEKNKYDIIKINIDENDKNIMNSVGFLKVNDKEIDHLKKVKLKCPNIFNRHILGSSFLALANTYDFKA
jgi:hypothetical protein